MCQKKLLSNKCSYHVLWIKRCLYIRKFKSQDLPKAFERSPNRSCYEWFKKKKKCIQYSHHSKSAGAQSHLLMGWEEMTLPSHLHSTHPGIMFSFCLEHQHLFYSRCADLLMPVFIFHDIFTQKVKHLSISLQEMFERGHVTLQSEGGEGGANL